MRSARIAAALPPRPGGLALKLARELFERFGFEISGFPVNNGAASFTSARCYKYGKCIFVCVSSVGVAVDRICITCCRFWLELSKIARDIVVDVVIVVVIDE